MAPYEWSLISLLSTKEELMGIEQAEGAELIRQSIRRLAVGKLVLLANLLNLEIDSDFSTIQNRLERFELRYHYGPDAADWDSAVDDAKGINVAREDEPAPRLPMPLASRLSHSNTVVEPEIPLVMGPVPVDPPTPYPLRVNSPNIMPDTALSHAELPNPVFLSMGLPAGYHQDPETRQIPLPSSRTQVQCHISHTTPYHSSNPEPRRPIPAPGMDTQGPDPVHPTSGNPTIPDMEPRIATTCYDQAPVPTTSFTPKRRPPPFTDSSSNVRFDTTRSHSLENFTFAREKRTSELLKRWHIQSQGPGRKSVFFSSTNWICRRNPPLSSANRICRRNSLCPRQ